LAAAEKPKGRRLLVFGPNSQIWSDDPFISDPIESGHKSLVSLSLSGHFHSDSLSLMEIKASEETFPKWQKGGNQIREFLLFFSFSSSSSFSWITILSNRLLSDSNKSLLGPFRSNILSPYWAAIGLPV
jgi:hypothetical protein